MKCGSCGSENPAGMKFCGECGTSLPRACPGCGAVAVAGMKFCGECGAALAGPAPAPSPAAQSYTPQHLAAKILQSRAALEGERKQVTVMFCDLANSTALAERLGPETMHTALDQFFKLALDEVHAYEGTINQFLGDGFMALFGAPITHEDHARRAVLAAMSLQSVLRERRAEVGEEAGVELQVRIGLNTGIVVVAGIGDNLRMDYTAIGDTTNLAARLQALAEPGSILVSEEVAKLVQGFIQLERQPPAYVKGKAAPVHASRVVGMGSQQSRQAELGNRSLSPFVGRERELAVLLELIEQVDAGRGQLVGITGEAGAGKSRLVHEFRNSLWGRRVAYMTGRCVSYGRSVPYLPLIHMLKNAWHIAPGDDAAAISGKVNLSLGDLGLDQDETLIYCLHLLGVEPGPESLASLSGETVKRRTFATFRRLALRLAQRVPVVLEIEDVHWIDDTSEECLASLTEHLAGAPVLILESYRSGYRPTWMDKSYATQLNLRRLAPRESQALIDGVIARAKLPAQVAQVILEKAEGNPFFLEELTRALIERGQSLVEVTVPSTIQGVLMARIDRLTGEQKRLLQIASVIGREFPVWLLGRIWDGQEKVETLLADLNRLEFLFDGTADDLPTYHFSHALTQDVSYESLLTGRRQTLHAAAGAALEELHAGNLDAVLPQLAYQYARTVDAGKAVEYLSRLAARSAALYAHAEAVAALEDALAHAERLPAEVRERRRLVIVLRIVESLFPLARLPQILELLLAHQEALVRLAAADLAGPYHFWVSHTYSYLGDQRQAAASASLAIAAAEQCGDEASMGKAHYVLARDGFWLGEFSKGLEHGERAVCLLGRSGELWWQGQAHWVNGFNHFVLGRTARAFAEMELANAIGEKLADYRLSTAWSTGYFHACLGDWERGIDDCRRGLAKARDPLNTAAAQGFLGYAYLVKGDAAEAVTVLHQAVTQLTESGIQQLCGWFESFLAEACLLLGDGERAASVAAHGLEVARGTGFKLGLGLGLRALARVDRAAGDLAAASRGLDDARGVFESIQAAFELGRTHLDLAALGNAQQDPAAAAAHLGHARRIFDGLQLPAQSESCAALAAELSLAS